MLLLNTKYSNLYQRILYNTTCKKGVWKRKGNRAKKKGTFSEKIVDFENFPIVCAVLPLDCWNYCAGEQGLID